MHQRKVIFSILSCSVKNASYLLYDENYQGNLHYFLKRNIFKTSHDVDELDDISEESCGEPDEQQIIGM